MKLNLLKTKKEVADPHTAKTPKNVETVRNSFMKSPHRSAKKHASSLGLFSTQICRVHAKN